MSLGWDVKCLQETETSPVANITAPKINLSIFKPNHDDFLNLAKMFAGLKTKLQACDKGLYVCVACTLQHVLLGTVV